MKKILVLDGYIGSWNISKQMVRDFLKTAPNDEVEVHLSSLGGEVSHAIDIYNQFQDHGNVTVIMSGFNASSSTLLALGAKKTIIHSNSFYLVHKPMIPVVAWSNMNVEEIDSFIEGLNKDKKFLDKLTAELTKMYMTKTGKSSKEVLDLMSENKWITSQEAKDFGFIDDVLTPAKAVNLLDDRAVAMLTENDLPIPVMQSIPAVPEQPEQENRTVTITATSEAHDQSLVDRFVSSVKLLFPSQNHKKADMKIFDLVNKCLGVTALESTDDKGVYLNEAQLQAINDQLGTVDRANLDKQQAETALNEAHTALDVIDPTVKAATTTAEKVTAIKAVIASKPGKAPAAPAGKNDVVTDEADWDTINNLPHNIDADKN